MPYLFSNFIPYKERLTFPKTDIVLLTPEHYYQAYKSKNKQEQEKILTAPTPGKAKRLGRKITLRPDWEDIKFSVMINAQWLKVIHETDYFNLVLNADAEDFIEYNNHHDNIWGHCLCNNCKNKPKENLLQQALLYVQKLIKEKY
jgi:ribA/ribD-fused uncharacterized protein